MVSQKEKTIWALGIGLASLLIVSLLFYFKFFWLFDSQLQDKLNIKEEVSDAVIIIAIDDQSIQEYGEWPWSRDRHAEMIEKLEAAKSKVIGYDFTFSEASQDDAAFFNIINKYDNLVFPFEGQLKLKSGQNPKFEKTLWPVEQILANNEVGYTTLVPDKDGIVRKVPYLVEFEGQNYEPLFVKVLRKYGVIADTLNPPVNESGLFNIKYFGPAKTFITYSFADVMVEGFDSSIFQDKIVLVGATAKNLHDEYFTPASSAEPISGVEIQANLIESFLQRDFIVKVDNILFYLFLFIILSILAYITATRKNLLVSLVSLVGIFVGYIFIVAIVYSFSYVLSLLYPLFIIVLTYFATYLQRFFIERIATQKLRASFSQYVAKEVVDDLIKNPEKIKLGGQREKLTILFSDIRGFTTLSEKMKAEELADYLNEYLTEMTDVIMENNGVVDKFIGDAIMAFWGAPIKNEEQEVKAVETAIKMIEKLEKFNKKMKKKGQPEIAIGIGLNTGKVVVGNLGSHQRFDYTVIGDDVNLASRLEGLTKYYGVKILISEKTRQKLSDRFLIRYLDKVAVKGKKEGVELYQVVCDEQDENMVELVQEFEKAVELYKDQKWAEAKKAFTLIQNKFPEDKVTQKYLERLEGYIKNPPQDFDGVFRADFK